MDPKNLPPWVEEFRKRLKYGTAVSPQPAVARASGQLCRLVMCNYVVPSSACGNTTIFLYHTLFYYSDGRTFDTGDVRVNLSYPQCTNITNNDPNVCVVKIEHAAALVVNGQIRVKGATLLPNPPLKCLNDLPEIPLYLACPTVSKLDFASVTDTGLVDFKSLTLP